MELPHQHVRQISANTTDPQSSSLSNVLARDRRWMHRHPIGARASGHKHRRTEPRRRRPRAVADQLRLILIFLVKLQVLQASVSSSNALPNKTGVTRATINSVPHSWQDAEASGSGGNSWATKCFPSN
jgi:hypothetical protein